MFVLKSKAEARERELRHMLHEAHNVANMHFRSWQQACKERAFHKEHAARLGESRDYWQNKATQAEAKLADLQNPKRDAGAQAFDSIVQHLDFAALERRVMAHLALTAPYGGTVRGARRAVYEGHAAEGGLQRHSIGDEYPFIVYGEGYKGRVRYRILDTRTGGVWKVSQPTSALASLQVRELKRFNHGIDSRGHEVIIPKE